MAALSRSANDRDGVEKLAAARAKLPAHCRDMLETAARVPGLEDSYRQARKTQLAALQPAEGGASGLLSRADGSAAPKRVPGLVTLRFATLYTHEVGDSVKGHVTAHAAAELVSKTCAGATPCSGRGACDSAKGTCDCDAGWGGSACEAALCTGGCGSGTCGNGTCLCASGFGGANCEKMACEGGCNGHGSCLSGTCACEQNYHGATCLLRGTGCPGNCNGNGRCAEGNCLCSSRFLGAACLEEINDCPDHCNSNGLCVGGQCQCYPGYSGSGCGDFCPHNCSHNGRCSAKFTCICAMGFSATDCSVSCPSRCSGHGECFDGTCTCYEGYEGADCSTLQPESIVDTLLGGMFAYYPAFVLLIYANIFLLGFCLLGYCINRCNGKFGTSAIPMWDYYSKKWRNAPLFEPALHTRTA